MTTTRAAVPFALVVPAYLTGYAVGAWIAHVHNSRTGAVRPRGTAAPPRDPGTPGSLG
jgi:hypothetical protein